MSKKFFPRVLSINELEAMSIADAAAYLDQHHSGWFNRIDLKKLDLDNCINCVLGQLFGGFATGMRIIVDNANEGWQRRHPFHTIDCPTRGLLVKKNKQWRDLIRKRQQRAANRKLTNQEVFDKVVAHLRKQNKQAIVNNTCSYRTHEGLMCAAGCLIKGEHYDRGLEGKIVTNPAVKQALFRSGISVKSIDLVNDLQIVHDDVDAPRNWESGLANVARNHGLNYRGPE